MSREKFLQIYRGATGMINEVSGGKIIDFQDKEEEGLIEIFYEKCNELGVVEKIGSVVVDINYLLMRGGL